MPYVRGAFNASATFDPTKSLGNRAADPESGHSPEAVDPTARA
jgi:hypothetical protein